MRVNRGDAKNIAEEVLAIFHGKKDGLSSKTGREYVIANYSKEAVTSSYVSLVSSLL